MNPFKRILALIVRPERRLLALKKELLPLRLDLERSLREAEHDPLSALVFFFDSVSKWHDQDLGEIIRSLATMNDGQYDVAIGKLVTLDRQFSIAGRSQYGINRTSPGETVTEHTVFLGNIYGLFTKTIAEWKGYKNSAKGNWRFPGMDHLNPYDVVVDQARTFLQNHAPIMIDRINSLATS